MSIHLSQVYEYLDSHPISSHPEDFQSLLEMIHYIYTENNPIDNDQIRTHFQFFDYLTAKLTLREYDQVFDTVCDLCLECEQAAFSHGILVGITLMRELDAIP